MAIIKITDNPQNLLVVMVDLMIVFLCKFICNLIIIYLNFTFNTAAAIK